MGQEKECEGRRVGEVGGGMKECRKQKRGRGGGVGKMRKGEREDKG